jgi:hypothetical protein
MVAALGSMGATSASASSKVANHNNGRYNCQFSWGQRYHRNNYRNCTQDVTGTVTSVGATSFTVQRGYPTTTTVPTTSTTVAATTTTTTVPATTSCSASTAGETQLNENGFTALATPSGTDLPQNAITNVINGNLNAGRFSTDTYQAVGDVYEVNMGSAQTFNEIEMAVPGSPTDYAPGYEINVFNGTSWVTVASCTGTSTPEIASFPTQTAQYVEVVLTAADTSYYWSINQFLVYNTTPAVTTTTVPASPGLWTVNVSSSTRYSEPCSSTSGLGGIAVNDIVTVSGYRAGPSTIDATRVAVRPAPGTGWAPGSCPGTTTTTTGSGSGNGYGYGGGHGRGRHGR